MSTTVSESVKPPSNIGLAVSLVIVLSLLILLVVAFCVYYFAVLSSEELAGTDVKEIELSLPESITNERYSYFISPSRPSTELSSPVARLISQIMAPLGRLLKFGDKEKNGEAQNTGYIILLYGTGKLIALSPRKRAREVSVPAFMEQNKEFWKGRQCKISGRLEDTKEKPSSSLQVSFEAQIKMVRGDSETNVVQMLLDISSPPPAGIRSCEDEVDFPYIDLEILLY